MDEQRFRARLAALDAVSGMMRADGRDLIAWENLVVRSLDRFEEWIMRPIPIDVSKVGDVPGPARQPCGAYLPPPWFIGTRWLTCTGQHVTAEEAEVLAGPHAVGWHKGTNSRRFGTHHQVEQAGPARCACGSSWPCTEAKS